jgi:integrase
MSKRGNNEGSIYSMADGRWRSAIWLGWKVNPTGKTVPNRKVFTGRTRKEVQDKLTAALRDQQLGVPVIQQKQTTGQFLRWWFEQVARQTVRPKTLEFYDFVLNRHLVPGLGHIPLAKLTPQHVLSFVNETGHRVSERTGRPLSPRSVKHFHRTLCTALNAAVKYGCVARNVAALVDPPAAPRSKIAFFTVDQARTFLDFAKDNRLFALYATVLSLGLRLGEGLGISWNDANLETGRFNVCQSLQRIDEKLYPGKGGLQLVEPKGGYSHRVVTLPAVAVAALRRHQARQEEEKAIAGTGWKGNPWNLVFTSQVGTPLDERAVLRRFQSLLAAAGLPRLRLHDLRHSAVAILIAQGVHPKAISELLGHSSVAFTMQVYGHIMEETKRETADKMDEALNPVATTVATKRLGERLN